MDIRRAHALAALLRWLGPWASERALPAGVARETWLVREGQLHGFRAHRAGAPPRAGAVSRLEAYVYHPRGAPRGVYLIAPGLHFLGPDDPRMDRLCRVLAAAGFVVVAPFLPAFVDLDVRPDAPDDLERFARATAERFRSAGRPTIFSISFGSWPALEVAARLDDAVDGVITFGGYADFGAAVRFCVDGVMRARSGDVRLAHDPLNLPALFLNLLPHLALEGDTSGLASAWRELVYRTWGKMELKVPGRLEPYWRELAPSVPAPHRQTFLVGAGAEPGAGELAERALARAGAGFDYADPTAAMMRLTRPVVVCHGRDDDVIPWNEARKLERALAPRVPTRLHLTGLYGHTGAGRPAAGALAREAATLLGIARALAHGSALAELFREP
ncbi:MAG: hypothetical protein OZ921_12840 [Sorangiineae bacterium]|nr:hypothetical protein [Polyangiaceae bacterium]MEB2323394.1 hypothetical protein [Sorangiineae bacterium]